MDFEEIIIIVKLLIIRNNISTHLLIDTFYCQRYTHNQTPPIVSSVLLYELCYVIIYYIAFIIQHLLLFIYHFTTVEYLSNHSNNCVVSIRFLEKICNKKAVYEILINLSSVS